MYEVSKRLEIAGSHSLNLPYISKCSNTHGHNWIITVFCRSKGLTEYGMIVDFAKIKANISDKLDHKNLNDVFDFNPTAENIAKWVCDEVTKMCPSGGYCYRVTVQESEGNIATYESERKCTCLNASADNTSTDWVDANEYKKSDVHMTWADVETFITFLADSLKNYKNISGVYGIPRGGSVLATMLSHKMDIPVLQAPAKDCVVLDDISDTGLTLKHYADCGYVTATMHCKKRTQVIPTVWWKEASDNEWIVYPWEV